MLNRTLRFSTNDSLLFPDGSIPVDFTIIVVARYLSASATSNVIFGAEQVSSWFLGWSAGLEDYAKFGVVKTSGSAPLYKFLRLGASNDPNFANVYESGVNIATAAGGQGGYNLVINPQGSESDCEVTYVYIYDAYLFAEDIASVTTSLGNCDSPMLYYLTHEIEIDECAYDPCGWQADCANLLNSEYECVCKEYIGWTGNGGTDGSNCTSMIYNGTEVISLHTYPHIKIAMIASHFLAGRKRIALITVRHSMDGHASAQQDMKASTQPMDQCAQVWLICVRYIYHTNFI